MADIQFAEAKGFRLDPLFEEGHIRQIKGALTRLGFYKPVASEGITAERDQQFNDALYAYQRKATIFFDDVDIDPGSTTERILNRDLAAIDNDTIYIWRTAGDDKVRHDHAIREGMRFRWNDLPDGDHPGEDYNCRCWAEPEVVPWHFWTEWLEERKTQRELYPDAINPTWSPLDFLSVGTITLGVKATSRFLADQLILKRPKGVPKDWLVGSSKKGIGRMYRMPNNEHTSVRVQRGDQESTNPGQRYNYVRWQKNGQALDVNGNPVKSDSLESHIPIKKFKFNLEKMR